MTSAPLCTYSSTEELVGFITSNPIRSCSVDRTAGTSRLTLTCSRFIDATSDESSTTVAVTESQIRELDERDLLPVHVASSLRRRGFIIHSRHAAVR
jgi:hypothetical protein